MASILIKNGRVFYGNRFVIADVFTRDSKIAAVAPGIDSPADYVYDAKGMTVSPGLVDIHVHMKGISSDEFGIDADLSTIPFGVTSAVDASGCMGTRALLDSFAVKNLVFLCSETKDNRAYFDSAEKFSHVYGDKAIGIKVYFDSHIAEVRDAAPLREIVDYAEKHGLRVMVHSSNSPVPMAELLSCLRPGDILTHAYHDGTHHVAEDDFECVLEAKKRGVLIDAGLAGHIHTDFGIFSDAIAKGALPDIISSDITRFSAYKRGGRYGLPLCMSIAKKLGMTDEDIFRAVTSTPAKAFGMEDEWGSLRVGRTADICVLEYTDEPFDLTDWNGNRVASEKGFKNRLTVVNGEVLYRD